MQPQLHVCEQKSRNHTTISRLLLADMKLSPHILPIEELKATTSEKEAQLAKLEEKLEEKVMNVRMEESKLIEIEAKQR
jgi:chromosome condensin MukBEF ATPase and DNA-binding subunit MukB